MELYPSRFHAYFKPDDTPRGVRPISLLLFRQNPLLVDLWAKRLGFNKSGHE